MNTDPKGIIDEAMQLPPEIRAFIAETLLESLDFEEDFPVSAAWMEEIHRRCAAIDNGTARLVDHESAMKQLRANLSWFPRSGVGTGFGCSGVQNRKAVPYMRSHAEQIVTLTLQMK